MIYASLTAEGLDLKHDDMIGESILPEEEEIVQQYVADAVTGQENALRRFPGSQPVSLARSNLDMLNARRYWVTWKVCHPVTTHLSTLYCVLHMELLASRSPCTTAVVM